MTYAPFVQILRRYWIVIGIFVVWDLWIRLAGINIVVMPSPSAVVRDIFTNWSYYLFPLLRTLRSSMAGLVGGIFLGSLAAIVACWSPHTGGLVSPAIVLVRATPTVVLIPVFARVLGYGPLTIIAVVTLACLFPAFVLVASSIRAVPSKAQDVATAYGASRWRRFIYVELPASLGGIATAVRFSAGIAFLIAMLMEFLTGVPGLGFVFSLAQIRLDTTTAWAASLLTAVFSVVLFRSTLAVEQKIVAYMQ